MNDTKINDRQKTILALLSQKGSFSRLEISQSLISDFPVSKITFVRDLNNLLDLKLIQSQGKGRATIYSLPKTHPFLSFIDLENYFSQGPDLRKIIYQTFNPKIFSQLKNLFTSQEKKEFNLAETRFSQQIKGKNKTIFRKELERFIIELSWKSSRIEGNTYSLLETEELIKKQKEAIGHTRKEAIMILNHKTVFDLILESKSRFRKLNIADIRFIHTVLTKDLSIDQGLRKKPVGITGTRYHPPDNQWQVKEYLEKIIRTINLNPHPEEKSFLASVLISYLQPFMDGNKRTSRMLSNAILLAYNYYPLSYRSVDEVKYKQALILFYEQNNLYHCKRLFLEQFRFASRTYFRF